MWLHENSETPSKSWWFKLQFRLIIRVGIVGSAIISIAIADIVRACLKPRLH